MKLRKKKLGSKTTPDNRQLSVSDGPKLNYLHDKTEREARERERRGYIDPQLGSQQYFDSGFDEESTSDGETANGRDAPQYWSVDAVPRRVWHRIAIFLDPADAASLAITSKMILQHLGWNYIKALELPENQHHRTAFVVRLDRLYPNHLFCFQCNRYHRRLHPGKEQYKASYVLNPIFSCPNASISRLPRTRLAHSRELPYAFVQLTCRARRFSPRYGIHPDILGRRWTSPNSDWSHHSRFTIYKGHLLMRVTSTCIAPPILTPAAQRILLFTREEYEPYFSVCAHWRDGELMKVCKCALDHIPPPYRSLRDQMFKDGRGISALSPLQRAPSQMVRGCGVCAPMRRCPLCPSEYLVEIRMVEDKKSGLQTDFKHAIVVSRWADLGDGTSPVTSREWAAIQGEVEYDSYEMVGRRAISGIFESQLSQNVPGARLLSLNPNNAKRGENDNSWY